MLTRPRSICRNEEVEFLDAIGRACGAGPGLPSRAARPPPPSFGDAPAGSHDAHFEAGERRRADTASSISAKRLTTAEKIATAKTSPRTCAPKPTAITGSATPR